MGRSNCTCTTARRRPTRRSTWPTRSVSACGSTAQFGIFGAERGQTRYGFIHGDWALNNSGKDGKYCGVNNELEILQQTGCYADFTFPSCDRCNPAQINAIYYADVTRHVPKAYSRGIPVRAGAGRGRG